MAWRERLAVSVSSMERRIAMRLDRDGIRYTTQRELPVTSCDFYFDSVPRPLCVFIDGYPHTKTRQQMKDETFRAAVRLAGYRVLELPYQGRTEKTLDGLYRAILGELESIGYYEKPRLGEIVIP